MRTHAKIQAVPEDTTLDAFLGESPEAKGADEPDKGADDADAGSESADSDADVKSDDIDARREPAERETAGTESDVAEDESDVSATDIESTMVWRPDDASCDRCGSHTERLWREGDALVCPACKSWET
jgi:hypothetical protein